MIDFAVGVMAKAPIPGFTKTRLIPTLGAEGAASLQAQLTLRSLDTAGRATPRVHLFTAGDDHHPFWAQCPPSIPRHPQVGADLGARMATAMQSLLATAPAALLIGTDAPVLRPMDLIEAASRLSSADVVLIPAEDGGYILIGLRQHCDALFSGIDWGSDQVMHQTRAALKRGGLRWVEMPALWDVDTRADYQRACGLALITTMPWGASPRDSETGAADR